jgi:hypothetical protein
MGLMQHHAIVASTWNGDEFERIRRWVGRLRPADDTDPRDWFLFGPVTMNSYRTIVMVPDGSKEGWTRSDIGDRIRKSFVKAMTKANYDDGSSPWDYVEVSFGELGAVVGATNCADMAGGEVPNADA